MTRIELIPQAGGQLGRFSAQLFHALGGIAQALVNLSDDPLGRLPHVLAVSGRRAIVVTSSGPAQGAVVRATVTNVGEADLGGRPVPLYVVDGENRLIESSLFTGEFKPCEGASFPKKFKGGDTVKACMVYLAPGKGDLTAVSRRVASSTPRHPRGAARGTARRRRSSR